MAVWAARLLVVLVVVHHAGKALTAMLGSTAPFSSNIPYNSTALLNSMVAALNITAELNSSALLENALFSSSGRFVGLDEDFRTPKDMLAMFGYPYEQYHVLTADGYVLAVDRIPRPGRQPVFLAVPIMSSSTVFLNLGPGVGLGYLLYDAGFDVWTANVRGSALSPDHLRLTTEDPKYWKFSFHEHGVHDNPAAIDLVLSKTGFPRVVFVGFSMGGTTFLVTTSLRPEYNDKLAAAFLMSPVCQLYHSASTLKSILTNLYRLLQPLPGNLQPGAFPSSLIRRFQQTLCRGELRFLCNDLWLFLFDVPYYEDYVGMTKFFVETFPGAGSFPTLWHFVQQTFSPNSFRLYDFNPETNLRVYGRSTPPSYPLHKITTPVYLYTGDSDSLVVPKDFEFLRRSLRNIVKHFRHPDRTFTHSDFVFARKARVVHEELIRDLTEFLGEPQSR